MITFPEMPDDE